MGRTAVGMIVFLRFINPAIVAPLESGVVDDPPTAAMKRGLTLLSKILQCIANQTTFMKEQHMIPFNEFVQLKFEDARRFVILNDN